MRGYCRRMIGMGLFVFSVVLIWQGSLTATNAQEMLKQPGDHDVVIMVGKLKRHFILHVPTHYDDNKPVPLVVMVHGHGGSAKAVSRAGWSQEADKDTFLVAYPDALRLNPDQPPAKDNVPTWNDGTERDGINTTTDDVGFIRELLTFIRDKLRVDKERIYLAGFSQGGLSTFNWGITLSDQIAAIGVASAPFVVNQESTPSLTHPMPLVYIIGTADQLNPLNGGEAPNAVAGGTHIARPVQDTIDDWLKLNQCDVTPTVILDKNGVHGQAYLCQPNFELDYYTIEGMEHTWSIGPRPQANGTSDSPANKLSGVQTMWAFFSKFTLNGDLPQH